MSVHMSVLIIALIGVGEANVALRKPAFSSSVYYDSKMFTADHGVDGNKNMNARYNGCFMTNYEDYNPWWMVDLLSLHLVETIRITDRYDGKRGHLRNFNIDVFKDNPYLCPKAIAKRCKTFSGIFPNVQTLTCNKDVIGRFIKLYLYYVWPHHMIVFCEFEVQAKPIVKDPSSNFYHRIGGVRYSEASASETLLASLAVCSKTCAQEKTCVGFNYRRSLKTCDLLPAATKWSVNDVSDSDYNTYYICSP